MRRRPTIPTRKPVPKKTGTQPTPRLTQLLQQAIGLHQQGQFTQAKAIYERILAVQPRHFDALHLLGVIASQNKNHQLAAELISKAIQINPNVATAYSNRGNVLQELRRLDEALASYDKAISLNPNYAEAWSNRGNALQELRRLDEALASYDKAISLNPNYAEAWSNRGNALQELRRLDEALDAYKKALALKPDYSTAHYNLGTALNAVGKLVESIEAYKKALAVKPDYALARAAKLHQQAHICDWCELKDDLRFLNELGLKDEFVPPFGVLSLEDAPDRHQQRSINYAQKNFPKKDIIQAAPPNEKPQRLRVGYFSADFHNHATMYLLAQVFAAHDKSQFEIIAFSYGPNVHDEMRQSLLSNVGVFHDVRAMSDMQVVELARSERLDIAVDLKGYTTDARLRHFAHRVAPLQISYLGYPGTLGADFIDYIIADPIVIPEENRRFYSENIIYLPDTYQPNDNQRVIADKEFTRGEMGLPDNGFVFCCFNNNYKISPKEFDIWMRLLEKVEGSVLWLLRSNKWLEENLKREAEVRGISGDRLIFAEKLSHAEHLTRHRLADLFLDTFNYNAHTTASDALWAGLPVITKLGEGFAARVAGSLLSAVGLKELITENEAEYEALALRFATNPTDLAQIKSKLAANRLTHPLFDGEMYTKHLERGYQLAYDRYFNGQPSDTIFVVG